MADSNPLHRLAFITEPDEVLARVAGSLNLYLKLVRRLFPRLITLPQQLQQLLQDNQQEESIRLVHTLKGNSGILGLEELQKLLYRVELQLRAGAVPDRKLLDTIISTTTAQAAALEQIASQP